MGEGDTLLIEDSSPEHSPSRSSVSGESSDGPLHEPTQLLYTQLLDHYEGTTDDADQTHHDMDMQTQLVDVHNFDGFSKRGGFLGPSEDDASKETQLVNGEVHSGSSSGKDGEVDSALSPLSTTFHRNTSHWLSEFTHRDRTIEGATGRASQMTFPCRDRYLGETQLLSDDESGEVPREPMKEQRTFADTGRTDGGGCPELCNRDGEVPHFLRNFDPNRRDYAGQRIAGGWHEVVEQSDDRGWESAVRGLQLVDSDASTDDEEENHDHSIINQDVTYLGEAPSSQNMSSRLSTRVQSNFCSQDLNKSPEPEAGMDEWGDGNGLDLDGRMDGGGSNIQLLNRLEKLEVGGTSQSTLMGTRTCDSLVGRMTNATPLSPPTPGSIRAASLRAAGLRASSCSSSGRHPRYTPQRSVSEDVQNFKQENNVHSKDETPKKAGELFVHDSPISRLSLERGGSSSGASFLSVSSNINRDRDCSRTSNEVLEVEKPVDYPVVGIRAPDSKVDTCRQREASEAVCDVSRLDEKNQIRGRKLFSGDDLKMNKEGHPSRENMVESQNVSSSKRVGEEKETQEELVSPTKNQSSPAVSKSLERRSSFGSGLFSTGSDMSYLNLQSPGEESQARALNMVDKLVWLNAVGLPSELQLEEEKPSPLCGSIGGKNALQSRVQVAEAKANMDDPFGVFDWVDSQNDEAAIFFGTGSTRAKTGKGTPKLSVVAGHFKQSGVGSKKSGPLHMVGARNKKTDKLPVKEKVSKSTSTTDKQKTLLSKSLLLEMENKRDQHECRSGRDLLSGESPDTRRGHGHADAALDLAASHLNRLGDVVNKQSKFSDKASKNSGVVNNSGADNLQHPLTTQVLQHHRRQAPGEQARSGRLLHDARLVERIEEARETSNQLLQAVDRQKGMDDGTVQGLRSEPDGLLQDRPVSGQSQPGLCASSFCNAKVNIATMVPEGIVHNVIGKVSSPGEMEEGDYQQDAGAAEMSHEVILQHNEGERQRRSPVLTPGEEIWFSALLQRESGSNLGCDQVRLGNVDELPGITSEQSKIQIMLCDNENNLASYPQGLQGSTSHQQQCGKISDEQDLLSKRMWKYPESSDRAHHGTRFKLIDLNGLQGGECLDGCLQAQSECGDAGHMVPTENVGPDTQVAIETMELLKTDLTIGRIGNSTIKENGNEIAEIISEVVPSSENDMIAERKAIGDGHELSESEKGQMAPRRTRSQDKYTVPESGDPGGSSNSTSREKGRRRRVTWAGSLEQAQVQRVAPRRGRSKRQHGKSRGEEDIGDNAADSSGHEEEAEDMKEAINKENGLRKHALGDIELMGSTVNDLDKIKRRFNMSDAAVARLLGTDEEEDAVVNQATPMKTRSLSHIRQEGAEGSDVFPSPKVKSIGKGLRSSRARSEDSGRKAQASSIADQLKSDVEEVVLQRNQNVQGNNGPAITLETHPSDNEPLPGRRRMRSIADVSSPSFQHTIPGRPPLVEGGRHQRGRRLVQSPVESRADYSEAEVADVTKFTSPLSSPVSGRLRAKGGPRSVRKRKEPDLEHVPPMSEVSPNSSKEENPTGFKRRRRAGTTCVLLSHGLNEDTIKQQKKVVAKLGGRIATSASECSHFIADRFVRTGNMLEAMAAGKPVVNVHWLETCSEAHRFIDEQDFILKDIKKEEDLGFSMFSTLSAAQRRPLLQGVRVYITPGTSPGPESLERIVRAAGGQVVDEYVGPAPGGDQDSDFCFVISSEEELDECIPLLEQGAKVYTPELLLSGVTCHRLDFSNDQLFKNFTTRRRRGASSSRRTTF